MDANILRTVVVQTIRLRHVDTNLPAAIANTRRTVVVWIKRHRHRVPTIKDAHVIHSNSVAVPMALPYQKDHTISDVIVPKRNSNVVRTKRHRRLAKTLKDALAPQVNMVVVRMVRPKRKAPNLKVARIFRSCLKRRAVSKRIRATVAISRSNISSMSSMERALASGTAAVAATTIDSIRPKTAKALVKRQKVRTPVICPKFMVLAPDTMHRIITIRNVMHAHNLCTVAVWVTTIVSKLSTHVRHCVSSTVTLVSVQPQHQTCVFL